MSKWYALHVVSGNENKIKQQILEQAAKYNMSHAFEEIIIPVVKINEIKKGKKVILEKKLMPGYVFIKMDMNDEAWHLVRNIPKISNFLGSKTAPKEISESEMNSVLAQELSENKKASSAKMFAIGEVVKVSDGPFTDFNGTIEKVDLEKKSLTLSIIIFGKPTPLELKFTQVEKVKKD